MNPPPRFMDRMVARAHRVACNATKGPIPAGYHVDHLCAQRACINPDHLEAVTPAEDTRRANRRRTHCRHDGLIPQRSCKVCRAAARRRQGEKQRAGQAA